MNEKRQEVLTPEQAAEYLQVSRETIYRYIREGKLVASKLGRAYRVPKHSLEVLLWKTRTREDVSLPEYMGEEIEEFAEEDRPENGAKDSANGIDGEAKTNNGHQREKGTSPEGKEMSGAEFLLSIAGMYESGETDISENAEQYIAEILRKKYS